MSEQVKIMEELALLSKRLNDVVAQPTFDLEKIEKMVEVVAAKRLEADRAGGFVTNWGEHEGGEKDVPELILRKSSDPKVLELQDVNDACLILSKIHKRDPRSFKLYQKHQGTVSELRKAMDTAESTGGGSWIPTGFSSQLIEQYRLALMVANALPQIDMPTSPYEMPVQTNTPTSYFVAESTADDPSSGPTGDITTRKPTLTAKKFFAHLQLSTELDEDSIIPMLPRIRASFAQSLADALEDCLINGDTASPHMDSDTTSATSRRKAFLGLRAIAVDQSYTTALTTFNADTLTNMRFGMGKYGVNPKNLVMITGAKGYGRLLRLKDAAANPVVLTIDKFGPQATAVTGTLAKFDGIDILISEFMREDLNANGIYDATETDTGILMVFKPGFLIGNRRKITLKTWENIRTDQIVTVATSRHAFVDAQDKTTENIVRLGRDLALTN